MTLEISAAVKFVLPSALAVAVVPLLWLGEQLEAVRYSDYRWSVPKGGFGYTSAVRSGPPA